jgi:hypothetical protein
LAAVRNTGIEDFDEQVNFRQGVFNLFTGLVHMTGEPLNLHGVAISYLKTAAILPQPALKTWLETLAP